MLVFGISTATLVVYERDKNFGVISITEIKYNKSFMKKKKLIKIYLNYLADKINFKINQKDWQRLEKYLKSRTRIKVKPPENEQALERFNFFKQCEQVEEI